MRELNVALLTISDWPARREIGFFWRRTSARAGHFQQLAKLAREVIREKLPASMSQI